MERLNNLTELSLMNNSLVTIPFEIGQLKNLKVLNLSYNKLQSLPIEIEQLINLEYFDLRGNLLNENDLKKLKWLLPATEFYF